MEKLLQEPAISGEGFQAGFQEGQGRVGRGGGQGENY